MTTKVLNLLCESSDAATSISTVHTQIHIALNERGFHCDTRYLCNVSGTTGQGFLERSIPLKFLRRPRRHPIVMRRLKRALLNHVENSKPDLIIVDGLYSAECLLSLKDIEIPVIMLVHGRTHFFRKHLRHLYNAANKGFPDHWHLVFVSQEAQHYWQKNHPDISPSQSVIENCIHSKKIKAGVLDGHDARATLKIPSEQFTIGAIARLSREKNLAHLLKAFAKLNCSDTRLLLIGEGKERDALETLARELNIEQQCTFSGFKNQAYQYLSAFDLFVMTSTTEGSPIALLEAMAAGCDVLCSDIQTLRDIGLPNECYFDLDEGEALAVKLAQKISEKESPQREKRISAIDDIVNIRFSPERFNENYQSLIRQLTSL